MSLADQFAAPAAPGGDSLDLSALVGSLLVFQVTEALEHVQTSFTEPGERTPAVRAAVHVLDGPHVGLVRNDALVFPKVLQGQLKKEVGGKPVLGRLTRGQALKPGQSAPYMLDAATPADVQVGVEWAQRQAASTFSGPGSSTGSEAPF